MERRCAGSVASMAVIAGALALFLHPLFTRGVSVLANDNPVHSLPFDLGLGDALRGGGWPFWDARIAFGRVEYAEGTAAWFHPWRWLVLGLFPGLAGHDLLYVTSFFLTGAGGFFCARALGAATGAALAGALAISFSPLVLDNLYNVSYAHSTAWAAIALAAFEHWWSAPSRRRVALLGVAVALSATAGYPPTTYALLLFLGVVLALRIALDRREAVSRIGGFGAAIALGLGIAALQILPLVELTAHSVRQESVAVLNAFPWQNFVGGLVLDSDPALYEPGRYAYFAAPLGTALAAVAIPFLPLLREPRAASLLAGVAVSICIASGPGNLVYDALRVVLPGLDRLRLLSPFSFVAVAPAGVLLALLLHAAAHASLDGWRRTAVAIAAGIASLFVALSPIAASALPWYRWLLPCLIAAAWIALAALRAFGRPRLAPLVWIAVLGIEIAVLRTGHRAWLPDDVLAEPSEVARILAERSATDRDARAIHFPSRRYETTREDLVRRHWKSPGYRRGVRESVRVQLPVLNLLHDIPFAESSGALPLTGHPELLAAMHGELRMREVMATGERALDRWGVRWVVLYGDLARLPRASGLVSLWRDPKGDLELLENTSAAPRHQWRASAAGEAAPPLSEVAAWRRAIEALPWVAPQWEPVYEWDAPAAGRLFSAIPWYPGWSATLDGRRVVPLRAADGFGMEWPAGPGPHRLALGFVPHSFHLGVVVSIASGIAAALVARGRG